MGEDIDGVDWTLDPMPEPGPDLDGWVLLSSAGGRFECRRYEGLGWVWETVRPEPH